VFGKLFDLLAKTALNGIVAILVAAFFWVVLAIMLFFALIPVRIIAGLDVAQKITDFLGDKCLGYKILYFWTFVQLMFDKNDRVSIKRNLNKILRVLKKERIS
jgi:hypothetical protein